MRAFAAGCVVLLLTSGSGLAAGAHAKKAGASSDKSGDKREQIDNMAKETLDRLFAKSANAKPLYDKAVGYAVFDNTKVSIGISGGGGKGVAVDKGAGHRTYMKMATGGVGLGLGGQSYQVVFLFEDAKHLSDFVEHGWEGGASANAAAGTKGANAEAAFSNGVAVYQLTDKGLMLQVDLAGTKYWKNDKLN